MIERLDIENMKSFHGRHEIDLSPITLVFGPNSSGKSTLLHSLAMLKQTLDPLASRLGLEEPPLALHGELIDLGSYPAAVNGHDLSKKLYVGLRFTDAAQDLPRTSLIGGLPLYAGLSFGFSKERRAAVLRRSIIGDDDNRLSFDAHAPGTGAHTSPYGGPTFRLLPGSRNGLLKAIDERRQPGQRFPGIFAQWRSQLERQFAADESPRFLGQGFFPFAPEMTGDGDDELAQLPIGLLGDDVFGVRIRALSEMLSGLAYLGPLRASPKRFQLLSNEQPTNVGPTGEHTAVFLARHKRLLADVNKWLERLDIAYRLSVSPVGASDLGVELGDLLATTLLDTRNNLTVTPQDVGFGISQLLPVVVEMLVGEGRTICVEQPEIHIHPGLQAKVGDLLIDAVKPGRANQVIVETHSEHLMLRIQRRLREQRPEWLTADKISVIYVDSDGEGQSHARRLHLDDQGNFVDEWPNGFFAERVKELFASD